MMKNDFAGLYSDKDKQVLKIAEDSLNPLLDRVQEIIEYAEAAGIKRIGIANCTIFNKEADRLEEILADAGLIVEKVNCKYGKVPFDDLVPGYKGISCNPAGQAKYLEEKKTELNIMMGLCLGHDMIFNARSKAPVTPLVVKDRVLNHYTLDVLKIMDNKLFGKPIRFAFAVNLVNLFESKHFGDADKYLIYEWVNNEFILLHEEVNLFKNSVEGQGHGLQEKGRAIIDFLRSLNINVLVSKQFGKNIHMVNSHFIPVIVSEDIPAKALDILARHMKWIKDELSSNTREFKLFTMKNGILKKILPHENS